MHGGAKPEYVSDRAKKRQQDEMGTLGSGNHYLEVQHVVEIYAPDAASVFGLQEGDIVVRMHCGSRGLGYQIGMEFLKRMAISAARHNIALPDCELACAPINSEVGQEYLGAMRAAINCALANRQILTHLVRQAFADVLPQAALTLRYDVSHNTCKEEEHVIAGGRPAGADRGDDGNRLLRARRHAREHGASLRVCVPWGRSQHDPAPGHTEMARPGRDSRTRQRGILIRSPSFRGVAEEAPGAYRDVSEVVDAADRAKLACKVVRLEPLICIKG